MSKDVIRVAAVGDLHCTRASQGVLQALFAQIAEAADMLLLAGDLTDHGLLTRHACSRTSWPRCACRPSPSSATTTSNPGQPDEVRDILGTAGVTMLDGDACEVQRIGIAGVKGFAGGFGQRALGAWGEPVIKQFVHEAVNEALKLEAALARLRTQQIIALLHYSPIQQTVEGEPLEIYPFVGSSRLEDPLNRYPVTLAVHGHAHRGQLEGATSNHVPVYNVSLPLLMRMYPDRPPFRVLTLPVDATGARLRRRMPMVTSDVAVCDDPLAAFYADALDILIAARFRFSSAARLPMRAIPPSIGRRRISTSSSAPPTSRARWSSSSTPATAPRCRIRTGSPRSGTASRRWTSSSAPATASRRSTTGGSPMPPRAASSAGGCGSAHRRR